MNVEKSLSEIGKMAHNIPKRVMRIWWLMGSMCAMVQLMAVSCGTVTPVMTKAHISYDGDDLNSGVIGTNKLGQFLVTEHFHDRYNKLIEQYAWKIFTVPPELDDGVMGKVTNDNGVIYFVLTREAMVNAGKMNQRRRDGK